MLLGLQGDGGPIRTAWTPAALPGIGVWVDANVGITVGAGVTNWADQSGNGNSVTPTTGVAPAFSATALNNKPGVVFNGTASQTLGNASVNLVTAGGARYLFVVCKPNGSDSTSNGFPFSFRRNTPMFGALLGWLGSNYVFFDGTNANTLTHTPGQQPIVGEWFSSGAGPTALQVNINGVPGAGLTGTIVASDTGTSGFDIGSCQYNSGS
jgi:hypothetical protein